MIRIELSVTAVLLSGYALWVFGMFAVAMVRSRAQQRRDARSKAVLPVIREALVDYIAGNDDRERFSRFVKESRRDMEKAILGFQATVGGEARDRLCELTMEQALLHEWCNETASRDLMKRRAAFENLALVCAYEPCRRLAGDLLPAGMKDPDSQVRFSAALASLQAGEPRQVESVFQLALSEDLLTRVLLADELRRHAPHLCKRAIPEVLASGDPDRVVPALDILIAWQRALPLDLKPVLVSERRDIRERALRLTPLAPQTADIDAAIVAALGDPDLELALIAAQCAGRLHVEAAVPALSHAVTHGGRELARSAAAALAELRPRGWATLRELGESSNPAVAGVAAEALARVFDRTGGV
jgi:hypothetical protein